MLYHVTLNFLVRKFPTSLRVTWYPGPTHGFHCRGAWFMSDYTCWTAWLFQLHFLFAANIKNFHKSGFSSKSLLSLHYHHSTNIITKSTPPMHSNTFTQPSHISHVPNFKVASVHKLHGHRIAWSHLRVTMLQGSWAPSGVYPSPYWISVLWVSLKAQSQVQGKYILLHHLVFLSSCISQQRRTSLVV